MWWWVFAVLYAIYFILGWRELDKKDELGGKIVEQRKRN